MVKDVIMLFNFEDESVSLVWAYLEIFGQWPINYMTIGYIFRKNFFCVSLFSTISDFARL